MGVLDDAIREHLELKRRHGASDEEIAQEEAEALGPARRGFPAAPESAAGEVQRAEEQSAEGEGAIVDAIPAELEPDEPPAAPPEPEPEAEPEPEPEPEPDLETRDSRLETEPETRDSRLETEPEPEQQSSDEDVLEETPEFLQDAPEHDRLWFEQKPPRDFDFE